MLAPRNPDYLTVADRQQLLRLAMDELHPRRDRIKVRKEAAKFEEVAKIKWHHRRAIARIVALQKLEKAAYKERVEIAHSLQKFGIYDHGNSDVSVSVTEWEQKWDTANLLDSRDIRRKILLCESRKEIKALIEKMGGN